MDRTLSFDACPFPAASLTPTGNVLGTNARWDAVAAPGTHASAALGLDAADTDAFAVRLTEAVADRSPAWIDLAVHVLDEKRWCRCHIWSADDFATVTVAVVSLREFRSSELPRGHVEHIESVLEHTADAITIVGEDMTFRFASGIASRWLGVSGSELEGHPALSFIYPDDQQDLADAFAESIRNPRQSIKARFRIVHRDGTLIWVEGIGTNMFDDPAINGVLITLNDITELVQTRAAAEANEAALELEKQRYEALTQFMPTGVFELDAENHLTFSNDRFDQLLALADPDDFTWDLFDASDREALESALNRSRFGGTTQATVRLAKLQSDGLQRWVTIRAVRQEGRRILASIEDATTQMRQHAELSHRADHDLLTGLPNRESLLVQLDDFTDVGEPIAVLFLDLDNFKVINDGLGHQVGDAVLIEIAERIRGVVRPGDLVGRLHGDEFLVVCRRTADIRLAREIAARVIDAVGQPLRSAPQRLLVSGSVGIALSDGRDSTSEELLAAADVAMYEAKRLGGSRAVQYNSELGKRVDDRLRLHGEIQRAAEFEELELYYQPIVDLRTGEAVRSEALIRWHHPTQGFILPDRFIPEIEKSELIDRLGLWILDQVLSDLAASSAAGVHELLPVNINVSPRQLNDESFADRTLELLDKHGLAGELLTIEITELLMMEDFAPVEKQLRQLREHGIGVAIDDFGTGYSALAYLQRFPFDQVKLDGAFIENIDSNPNDQAIVGSIVELVASLGSNAIAEKVERQTQVDALIALGCPYAQGFFLGGPQPLQTS